MVGSGDPPDNTPIRNVAGNKGLRRNLHIAADSQVIEDAALTAHDHVVPHRRRTPDPTLCDYDTILPDIDIVPDLNKIIDFRAAADACDTAASPVDSTVGADFNIVFDNDRSNLRNLAVFAAALEVAEAVRSDRGVGMNQDPIANGCTLADNDVRP